MGGIGIAEQKAVAQQHYTLDVQALYEIMEHRGHENTEFNHFISNSATWVSLSVPATTLAIGILHNDKVTIQKGLYFAGALTVSSLVTYGMKYSINRQRPYHLYPGVVPVDNINSPSFPSGHTSMAFATATSLVIAFPKWYVIIPAYTWAATVGYSRMYLGVHYPTDVAVGAIVGAGSAWLTYIVNRWLQPKDKRLIQAF